MKHRVILWGTGFVGKMVLRELIQHPDFELAGLIVHSRDKVGKDAGEIAGLDAHTGVRATDDVDAALAVDADAVAYFANADIRQMEAIKDMAKPLARGFDVVNTSVFPLIHPKSAPSSFVAPIERACREGGSSFFTTGIDPGFCQDLIPMTLMGLTGRVDRVRIQEILDYSTYPNPRTLFEIMGFGRPVDDPKVLQLQPGALRFAWGCAVHMLADGLGVTLDEIREVHQRRGGRAHARAARRHREEGHHRGAALRAAGHRRRRAAHRRRARDAPRAGRGARLAGQRDGRRPTAS